MQHNTEPKWIRWFRDSIRNKAITTSEKADVLLTLDECADEIERLRDAIGVTLGENLHLADGENCTLIHLKRALSPNNQVERKP